MYNVEESAAQNRSKRRLFIDAMAIIDKMEGSELFDFARLMMPVSVDMSEGFLKDKLEEIAEENPHVVIREFKNSDRQVKQVFY